MISLSGSLFLVRAAMLPSTTPEINATKTAMPPSFADTPNELKIVVLISLPVFAETPKSPCSKLFRYKKNCSQTGLSRLKRCSRTRLTSSEIAFSPSKGPPGIAFIAKNVMPQTMNTVRIASSTLFTTYFVKCQHSFSFAHPSSKYTYSL